MAVTAVWDTKEGLDQGKGVIVLGIWQWLLGQQTVASVLCSMWLFNPTEQFIWTWDLMLVRGEFLACQLGWAASSEFNIIN